MPHSVTCHPAEVTFPWCAYAEETQAPGQPTAVRTMTSSESAVVSWLAPEDNTLVRTYMIGYGEGVPDVKWIYVNGSQRNVTIHDLSMLRRVLLHSLGGSADLFMGWGDPW